MKLRFDFKADGWPNEALCFESPIDLITAYTIDEVVPALEAVEHAASAAGLWAAGFVAYEAAPAFDQSYQAHASSSIPLVWFGIFKHPVAQPANTFQLPMCVSGDLRPAVTRDEYDRCVNDIREAAGRGNLYQANYTFPLKCGRPDDSYAMYCQLQLSSQCGFGAYIDTGELNIISISPELFFRYSSDGREITTRPMKGTRTRGRWLEEDLIAAKALAKSEKDLAENLMIVDLLRNDLGRIAAHGTVRTPKLFEVERYPTVWQMTSTITARSRPDVSLADLFAALFPCGSVTGAPKMATMSRIAQLEGRPRGVYCGAIGMVRPGGNSLFSVAIRTITIDKNSDEASYSVGGGITWDSTIQGEYEEAISKSKVLNEPDIDFDLVETLRLEHGEFHLQQRHIDRISESALYFARPLDRSDIVSALSICAANLPEGAWRIRLLANRYGAVRTECAPLKPVEGSQKFRIAQHPISSSDQFLFHKTTIRRSYERAAAEIGDLYDVLLFNERGEFTEFTRGNLVIEIGAEMRTPLRSCGLLGGTLREEEIHLGKIVEQVITKDLLERADRIWFLNSVRGWVEMEHAQP